MAAGAVAAVQAMLQQSARMHVILLAVTPRGERCALQAEKRRQTAPVLR